MALAGEAQHLDLLAEQAEQCEEVLALLDVAAEVALGVDDEERRLDLPRVGRRRHLQPLVDVLPHRPAELPLEDPEHVARAEGAHQVVDRPLRQRRREPLRVADHPRRHVAAVRAAEDAEPVPVEEGEPLERGVDDAHQVLVVDAAPAGAGTSSRPADRPPPRLRAAGAAARVRVENAVAGARVDLDLVEEPRLVLGERAAVDREQDRVPATLVEARRSHEPRVDLGSVGRDGGEPFRLGDLAARDEVVADGGDALSGSTEQFVRARRRARGVDEHSVEQVVQPDRLLAPDEELRLARAVRVDRVDVHVAAVLDPERDAVAVPARLAYERERSALPVE